MQSYLWIILAATVAIFMGCSEEEHPVLLEPEKEEALDNPIDSSLQEQGLPVIEIHIAEKYLWSLDSGLFVDGEGATPNYMQKWEHKAFVTGHFDTENSFSDTVGFRIKGVASRHKPNKSIGLYWRGKYGNSVLNFPVFEGAATDRFRRLKLSNGGNHGYDLMLRQTVITRLLEGMTDVDFVSSRPVSVYINDQYWGLYYLQELLTPHYFGYKYGHPFDSINILAHDPRTPYVDDGSRESWITQVIEPLAEMDLSQNTSVQKLEQVIDMENFIDYFIIQTYINNRDWPHHNTKWWSARSSPWRHILYDLDISFEPAYAQQVWLGDFFNNTEGRLDYLERGYHVFNHLMTNEDFQKRFFTRYLYFLDEVFTDERVAQVINDEVALIGDEYRQHAERWNKRPYFKWVDGVFRLKEFNAIRNPWMRTKVESWIQYLEEKD
jgi:hypothetical protein